MTDEAENAEEESSERWLLRFRDENDVFHLKHRARRKVEEVCLVVSIRWRGRHDVVVDNRTGI